MRIRERLRRLETRAREEQPKDSMLRLLRRWLGVHGDAPQKPATEATIAAAEGKLARVLSGAKEARPCP